MMTSQYKLALILIEGIDAAEERVEGNGPVKGATMGFKNRKKKTALW